MNDFSLHKTSDALWYFKNDLKEDPCALELFLRPYGLSPEEFSALSETETLTRNRKTLRYSELKQTFMEQAYPEWVLRFEFEASLPRSPTFGLATASQRRLAELDPAREAEIFAQAPCLQHSLVFEKPMFKQKPAQANGPGDVELVDVDSFMYGNPHCLLQLS